MGNFSKPDKITSVYHVTSQYENIEVKLLNHEMTPKLYSVFLDLFGRSQ